MAYVSAVFDRTQADIDAKVTKAYFNVADWVRLYGNALFVRNEIQTATGAIIPFDVLSTPTVFTIPSATVFNTLLANIERTRLASGIVGTTVVTSNWLAGGNTISPTFQDVNHWEQTLDIIHSAYLNHDNFGVRSARTNVSHSGTSLTYANKWRA